MYDSEYLHTSKKVKAVQISDKSGWDIDNLFQFQIAEYLLKNE